MSPNVHRPKKYDGLDEKNIFFIFCKPQVLVTYPMQYGSILMSAKLFFSLFWLRTFLQKMSRSGGFWLELVWGLSYGKKKATGWKKSQINSTKREQLIIDFLHSAWTTPPTLILSPIPCDYWHFRRSEIHEFAWFPKIKMLWASYLL